MLFCFCGKLLIFNMILLTFNALLLNPGAGIAVELSLFIPMMACTLEFALCS